MKLPTVSVARLGLVMVTVLLLASCGDSTEGGDGTATTAAESTSPEPTDAATTVPTTAPAVSEAPATTAGSDGVEVVSLEDLEPLAQTAAQDLAAALSNTEGVWPGFALVDVPTYVAPLVSGDPQWAVVAGYDSAAALGSAASVDGLDDVYYVTDLTEVPGAPANGVFDFFVPLAGTESFVVAADLEFDFAAPGTGGFLDLIEHEAFHVYQEAWGGTLADQSQAYDFSEENLELAMIEDAALVAAVDAADDAASLEALGHFVAVRRYRQATFASTLLDDSQEWSEGTAQWVGVTAGDAEAPVYADAVIEETLADPAGIEDGFSGVDQWFSWQRFYLTGAAVVGVLDRLDMPDRFARMEAGEYPVALATEFVGDAGDPNDEVLAAARATYDPTGDLAALAVRYATVGGGGSSSTDDPDVVFADGLEECLAEAGVAIEDLEDDEAILPPEALVCFD